MGFFFGTEDVLFVIFHPPQIRTFHKLELVLLGQEYCDPADIKTFSIKKEKHWQSESMVRNRIFAEIQCSQKSNKFMKNDLNSPKKSSYYVQRLYLSKNCKEFC